LTVEARGENALQDIYKTLQVDAQNLGSSKYCLISAAAPAAIGVAMDVPVMDVVAQLVCKATPLAFADVME
jgi:hypothetical protein